MSPSPSTHTMPSSTKTTDAAATAAADDDGCSKATMDSKAISAGTQPPLSFSRWFAFQSYTTDLLLLLLDLIVIAPPYVAQLWVNRQCFPLAGAPHATQQTLPLDTAAYRADSIISRFPCAASYTEQLAYTVATGAALDPWVRIRAGDWGNLLYVCMLILTLAIAFASPRLYVRCRWPLFAANAIAHLAGNAVAAVAVPVPMLALLGPSFYGSFRRRVGVLHTAWRSLVVLRVPLPQQLALALPVWLLTTVIAHTADRRLQPAAAATTAILNSSRLPQPLSTFLVVAVLPCVVAYLLDSYLLRPRYAAFLLRQGRQQQQQQQMRWQERRQGQKQLQAAGCNPRPCGTVREGEGAAAPVRSSPYGLHSANSGPVSRSPTVSSPDRCFVPSPSNSPAAAPCGPSGREAGGAAAAGRQASAQPAPAPKHSTPAATTSTPPAATASPMSPSQQATNARGGGGDVGVGTAAAAAASGPACDSGHTRAPIQRRPSLDITQLLPRLELQTASSSPCGLLLPSTRPTPASSAHVKAHSPFTAAAASAASTLPHLSPFVTPDPTEESPAVPLTPPAQPPQRPRPREARSSAAASTRYTSCLYRQACPLGQAHFLSVKVPLRRHAAHAGTPMMMGGRSGAAGDAARTAAGVSAVAAAAVRRYNSAAAAEAAATAAATAAPGYGMDLGAGGGVPCIAASAGLASPPRLPQPMGCMRVLSSLVVAGCVHLLMVVRAVPVQQQRHAATAAGTGAAPLAAAAHAGIADEPIAGRATGRRGPGGYGVSYAVHGAAAHSHVTVDVARGHVALSGAGDAKGEGQGRAGQEATEGNNEEEAAWRLAMEQEVERAFVAMITGEEDGLPGRASGSSSGGGDEQAGGNPHRGLEEALGRCGFVWPPAVPVAPSATAGAATCLGGSVGGEGEGYAGGMGVEGVAVTLVLPRGLLRGQRAVRCVVAGGEAGVAEQWDCDGAEAEAHVATGELDSWGSQDEPISATWAAEGVQGVGEMQGRREQQQEQEQQLFRRAEECEQWLVQQQLHADVEVDLDQEGLGGAGRPGTPGGGGWGEADDYVSVRLALPASAVCAPGLLSIHLLPPRQSSTATTTAMVGANAVASALLPAHTTSTISPLLPPDAPLTTLPLLALPPAAAAEVCGLYDSVVRRAAAGATDAEDNNSGSSKSSHDNESSGGAPVRTEVRFLWTAAADAIASSGLDGLLYDMGTLLQLPAASSAPAPDPWVWRGLLLHLGTWRMAACLGACLGALQRAGVDLRMWAEELQRVGEEPREGGEEECGRGVVDGLWATRESGAGSGQAHVRQSLNAAGAEVEVQAETEAEDGNAEKAGAPPPPHHQIPAAAAEGGLRAAAYAVPLAALAACPSPGPGLATATLASATAQKPYHHQQPPSDAANAQGVATPFSPPSSSPPSPGTPLSPPLPPSAARSLLLGFSPAPLEHRYQQYKAACCRARDCAGLVLLVAIRATGLVRTALSYRAAAAAGDAAAAAEYAGQAASEALWTAVVAVPAALALFTTALSRHRTRLLLLKGLADYLALTAITWPPPSGDPYNAGPGSPASMTPTWPSPLPSWLPHPVRHLGAVLLVLVQRRLRFPHTWHRLCRRFGLHLLHFGVWEPTMMQMSPRHQAVVAALQLLPMAFFARQVQRDISSSSSSGSSTGYGGSWLSAADIGVGTSLLTMALSCVTDLHCRRSFLRQERVRQQQEGQEQGEKLKK